MSWSSDLPCNVRLSQSDDLQSFKVVSGSHIYTFDQEVGKWVALDLDAILDGKQPVEKSDVRPRSNEIVEVKYAGSCESIAQRRGTWAMASPSLGLAGEG